MNARSLSHLFNLTVYHPVSLHLISLLHHDSFSLTKYLSPTKCLQLSTCIWTQHMYSMLLFVNKDLQSHARTLTFTRIDNQARTYTYYTHHIHETCNSWYLWFERVSRRSERMRRDLHMLTNCGEIKHIIGQPKVNKSIIHEWMNWCIKSFVDLFIH